MRPSSFRTVSAAATVFLVVCLPGRHAAAAAEIVFRCAEALRPSLQLLLPEFEAASGHHVKLACANMGANAEHVRRGDEADVAIVSPKQWDSLKDQAKIAPDTRVVLGVVGIGVFVGKGAVRPEIGTVDALKRALMAARSIAVRDPSSGSPVGAYIVPLFERLGVATEIKPKLRLTADRPYRAVLAGEAEIGFSTMTEIVETPEVDLVGPLPNEIQNTLTFIAAIPANAQNPVAAKKLIEFLTSPKARAVFQSKGVQPG